MKPSLPAFILSAAAMISGAHVALASPRNVCIRALDVDHTTTPDDRTILFYMKDGKVWRTTLTSVCPELSFNGFAYEITPPDEICGKLQTIRVIRSGSVCELGPLVAAPDAGPQR